MLLRAPLESAHPVLYHNQLFLWLWCSWGQECIVSPSDSEWQRRWSHSRAKTSGPEPLTTVASSPRPHREAGIRPPMEYWPGCIDVTPAVLSLVIDNQWCRLKCKHGWVAFMFVNSIDVHKQYWCAINPDRRIKQDGGRTLGRLNPEATN